LAADIREGRVVAVRLRLQDQCAFASVTTRSEQSSSEVQAQLHRHVESRYSSCVDLNPRQVMDAPIALANHFGDFTDPDLCSVYRIERTSRVVARRDDCKGHRAEDRPESVIERAVDENSLGGWRLIRAQARHAVARTPSGTLREWPGPWRNADRVSGEF